jgi:alkylated DNA repair protein (DNA oxidative demethylase)
LSDLQSDLLERAEPRSGIERLGDGAVVLRGFARQDAKGLVGAIAEIAATAPFRHMVTPGGFRMSVAMTSCGETGWITDRRGYRYAALDPETGRAWPEMPPIFRSLAARAASAAGFSGFVPDSCLINRYEPETRLSLHRDENERDFSAPIVSVSLGLSAVFLFGGDRRNDRPQRVPMHHGDVAVWGGPARLFYHGVAPLADGEHELTGRCRINLTLRKAL